MVVDVDGSAMHALVQGTGPPVVLIHGAHGSSLDFSFRLAPLLARRYTTIAVDRPGAGRSARPPDVASPRAQARVLRAAVAAMGFDRPILVGHSLGAAVALAWALDDEEVKALVSVAGYLLPGDYRPPLAEWLGKPLLGPLLAATVVPAAGRLVAPSVLRRAFLPDATDEHYARLATRNALKPSHLRHDAADRRAIDAGLREIRPLYGGLHCPLVAVAGLHDGVVSPWQSRRLVELVPEGELVLLPATGHIPHVTRPDAVMAAIDRASVLAGRRVTPAQAAAQGATARSGAPRRAPSA